MIEIVLIDDHSVCVVIQRKEFKRYEKKLEEWITNQNEDLEFRMVSISPEWTDSNPVYKKYRKRLQIVQQALGYFDFKHKWYCIITGKRQLQFHDTEWRGSINTISSRAISAHIGAS